MDAGEQPPGRGQESIAVLAEDVVEFIEICRAIETDPNKLLKILIQRAA